MPIEEEQYLDNTIKNKYQNSPYRIPLRNRAGIIIEFSLVEKDDFDRVNAYKWHLSGGYANSTINGRNIRMHHFVFKRPKEDHVIDHINQDKLDNRMSNLRETTRAGNTNNISKTNMNTSSKFKGVNLVKHKSCFRARYDDLLLYYGKDERQAAIMYDIYTYQQFGEHANNNKLISYEEAMKHEKIEKQEPKVYENPYIRIFKNKYFRVRRTFRKTEYVFYFKTLKKAKEKLDEINFQIHHTLLMEEFKYRFSPIQRNNDGIAYISYKDHQILVDDEDWHELNKEPWYVDRDTGYAYNNDMKTMHRLLMPCDDRSKVVHHVNGNRLDNCRHNLEIVSATANAHQKKEKSTNTSSKYFGVAYHKPTKKWMARIKKEGVQHYLGVYEKEEDAANAYNEKALELYGHSANLNLDIVVDVGT